MINIKKVSIHLPLRRARLRRKLISGNGSSGGEIIYNDGFPFVAALQDIEIEIKRGDCVALIGHNGSGKTTLLRTIAGIYEPREGLIETHGKIATMFSSSLSLSDMETGIQNIEFSAVLHGLSADILKEQLPKIVQTCELGEYLEVPVSMYSDGMRARLGLAMAILCTPEILLVDEAMTAIDTHFLTNISEKTNLFGGEATITIIATHAREIQDAICNKAIWLKRGRIKMSGDYQEVSRAYRQQSNTI